MKKIITLILAVVFCICLCACDSEQPETNQPQKEPASSQSEVSSNQEESMPKFEVIVTDADGNAVEGVMVQLCKDSCVPKVTDENGVAVFNVEVTDGYKLSVMSCPEGYEYVGDAEIYLEDGDTEYTLEIQAKEEA